jgi:hypothetical protein
MAATFDKVRANSAGSANNLQKGVLPGKYPGD